MQDPIIFKFTDINYLNASIAESMVAHYISKEFNYNILAQNFRYIGTEIDIICKDKNDIIGIEVKYRKIIPKNLEDYNALITNRKKISLQKGLLYYLTKTFQNFDTLRLDLAIVSIINKQGVILYYKNFIEFETQEILY